MRNESQKFGTQSKRYGYTVILSLELFTPRDLISQITYDCGPSYQFNVTRPSSQVLNVLRSPNRLGISDDPNALIFLINHLICFAKWVRIIEICY